MACAEPIVVTSAALSPAARHISSKSPVVSGVGRMAANFGIKYSRPPSMVLPMVCGGSGGGGVFVSLPSHSRTTRLRITRIGASGHSGPKMQVLAMSSSVASTIRRLYSSCAFDSTVATSRVPTHTPAAPKHKAAAIPLPSAIPPAAITGAGCTASTGVWTTTGHLAIARYLHTATLLQNALVLVAAGFAGSGDVASAELYSPTT